MAITTWTSLGMRWDDLGGRLPTPYVEALRLALLERWTAAGLSLGVLPDVLETPLAAGELPGTTWADAWLFALQYAAPRYVNHLDHAGNWSGLAMASVAPFWTWAGLVTAAGITTEQRLYAGSFFRASWARQQYALLNLLRWTRLTGNGAVEGVAGTGATYAAAKAALEADTWTTAAMPGVAIGSCWGEVGLNALGTTYSAFLYRPVIAVPTATYAHQLDLWAYPVARADEGGGGSTYDEPYLGLAAGVTARAYTDASPVAATTRRPLFTGTPSLLISTPAAPGATRGFDWGGTPSPDTYPRVVLRWDVAGGFNFLP